MKKIVITLLTLFLGVSANAEILEVEFNVNMNNFWEKTGKKEEKVVDIGTKLLNLNQIKKRVVFRTQKGKYIVNAQASFMYKEVLVYEGLLNYVDNDDELAAVIAHEMAHSMDYYDGFGKLIVMNFNRKSYEYKADLKGIDYMVKAGYNPLAMITVMNKISGESIWDWGILWTHPKTSKRLLADYEYIYKKYPQFLTSSMTKNVNYVNWVYTASKDIKDFQQKEHERASKREQL